MIQYSHRLKLFTSQIRSPDIDFTVLCFGQMLFFMNVIFSLLYTLCEIALMGECTCNLNITSFIHCDTLILLKNYVKYIQTKTDINQEQIFQAIRQLNFNWRMRRFPPTTTICLETYVHMHEQLPRVLLICIDICYAHSDKITTYMRKQTHAFTRALSIQP